MASGVPLSSRWEVYITVLDLLAGFGFGDGKRKRKQRGDLKRRG